jgi:DNA-directed RNA polymerase subunit M/transcription elongation factor TFIIS
MAKIEESFNKCPLCGAGLEPVTDRDKGTIDCPKCRSSLWFRSKDTANVPGHEEHDRTVTYFRVLEKPGKNSRCPCGSGHAYVRCCGRRAK